jgi:excinuclease UvrABC nuclease subunit
MKMCLAPCFKGCTDEEHAAEVKRVQAYFDTGGVSLLREFSEQREAASEKLAFEEAAAIHTRIEKLNPVVSQVPEVVRRLDRLSALVIQPGHLPGSVALFRIDSGRISGPVTFSIQPAEHARSQSMEARIHETLETFAPAHLTAWETMEHIAILKRWYYRSSRIGEIFFAGAKGELPMRRIVRGIARVYRGEKAEPEESSAPAKSE